LGLNPLKTFTTFFSAIEILLPFFTITSALIIFQASPLKKAFLAGLGTMAVTKDKVKNIMEKLEKEGKITVEEAEKFTKEIVEAGEKEYENYKEEITNALKNMLKSLDLVKRQDIEEIMARISSIEDRIEKLEKSIEK